MTTTYTSALCLIPLMAKAGSCGSLISQKTGFSTYFTCDPGVPWCLSCKESACNAGHAGSIPGPGRFPGEGNGNPLQYSCLESPMDGGAWCPWGRKELDMTERLNNSACDPRTLPRLNFSICEMSVKVCRRGRQVCAPCREALSREEPQEGACLL